MAGKTLQTPGVIGSVARNVGEVTPLLKGKMAKPSMFDYTSKALGIDVLVENFGFKLLLILFVSQHIMKGFVSAFTSPCVSYLFRSYSVSASQRQVLGSVASLPWAMKPVIGLVSDAVPIFGYNKAPYMCITTVLSAVALCTIGFLPQSQLSVYHMTFCLFLFSFQIATCDLLTEAKYSEKMQEQPEHGPALISYVWGGLTAGGLVATALVGPTMTYFGYKLPYAMAAVPSILILVPLCMNYLEEKPMSTEEQSQRRAELAKQPETMFLCILMFVGTLFLTVLGFCDQSPKHNAIASIVVASVMLVAFSVVLKPVIAKVNAFFLLQTALGVSIGGASFYFYTDTAEMYREGPHFSLQFYTSVLGVVGSIFSLLGIWLYQRYATGWKYRGLLLTVNIVVSVLSLLDLMLFTRMNKKLGIPDEHFVLGFSVLGSVIMQWQWMPGVVLTSQLCPKGMEATMFALLAGCHNLGGTVASNCGAFVLQYLGCEPSGALGESKQFDYFWKAAAISILLPSLTLVLIPALIPDARQTDKLMQENDGSATSGSLWQQWRGTPQAGQRLIHAGGYEVLLMPAHDITNVPSTLGASQVREPADPLVV